MDYQDCYGIYIKIQDYIENFTESSILLVWEIEIEIIQILIEFIF